MRGGRLTVNRLSRPPRKKLHYLPARFPSEQTTEPFVAERPLQLLRRLITD
jgi:hypothetical protein